MAYFNAIHIRVPVNALAVSPVDGALFAANAGDGVRAYAQGLVKELAHLSTPGVAQAVEVKGNLIYEAAGPGGVSVLKYKPTPK